LVGGSATDLRHNAIAMLCGGEDPFRMPIHPYQRLLSSDPGH